MTITHTNRKGKTYFLHRGKTKTGKAKYYFSSKREGECVESIPPGYEVYENLNAQVFLRKIRPKLIRDEEISIVEQGIKKHSNIKEFKIDVRDKVITVYLSDLNKSETIYNKGPLAQLMTEQHLQINRGSVRYFPMMRFVLINEEERIFCVERMCFRGGDDHWMSLHQYGDLEKLVQQYAEHLGEESFYDLM
ncbi:MAG: hypothetical protein JXR73_20140 [Candidatus Omnitrophica bacterium]|nr:hypothetical protein [Candidatus Omnitrophota bacterium]